MIHVHVHVIPFVLYTDVVSIEKTGEHFRLLYDVKGRFTIHRITPEEAKVSCMAMFNNHYYYYTVMLHVV